MSGRSWTSEQLKAIETLNRRLLISAAAGSGKTAVLVERIIRRILDKKDPVSVDRLLVVTFTKAAAAEMKDRIRDALEAAGAYDQMAIIDSANIQTIDSFCLEVVKDHTDELDIDPAIRIADEAELRLIRADVMEEMLEDYYEASDEKFLDFVERFGKGTAGKDIDTVIEDVFRFAQVSADPKAWYEKQLNGKYDFSYVEHILDYSCQMAASVRTDFEKALELCRQPNGPVNNIPVIENDLEIVDSIISAQSCGELIGILADLKFMDLSRKKTPVCDEELKERFKKIRDDAKKEIIKLKDAFGRTGEAALIKEADLTAPYIETLILMTQDFAERFANAKKAKNVVDFNDIEHMALEVLKHTEEYKERFLEIYVDEYQDTNELQEEIIGTMDNGCVFMVGDVKQSIYRFRQARPEIFIDKYSRFADIEKSTEDVDTLVKLSSNFRSAKEVLEDVNGLFRRIMDESLGKVSYTPDVALNYGNKECTGGAKTEMLICDTTEINYDDDKPSAEARMIARKIAELKDEDPQIKYSNIVILLRSTSNKSDAYLNELLNAGIPAYCETNKGYFDSLEVRTMLAVLAAIDNGHKDIPMAAYLKSPMIGMSDDELALMDENSYKLKKARAELDHYRKESKYLSVEELITDIYDRSGYYDYASTLPAGKTRKANLDKLRAMAAQYAKTGYKGLFNFLRYVENLKTYDTDFGEAGTLSENDDAVRIMSIHKSKGLEFPIVFIANIEKHFNTQDLKHDLVLDADLGIGCEIIDLDTRIKKPTLKEQVIKNKMRMDSFGEELRILYVAMTRAKKRIFLTGTTSDRIKLDERYMNAMTEDALLPFAKRFMDDSYLNWILDSGIRYPLTVVNIDELERDAKAGVNAEKIREHLDALTIDVKTRDAFDEVFDFEYEHQADVDLKNKISISELKKRWQEDMHKEELLAGDGERSEFAGDGMRSEFPKAGAGAERGTVYHSVMEHLDYAHPENTLNSLPEVVRRKDIEVWLASDLGKKCSKAALENRLFRERQFIMGLSAKEIKLADSDELVLVQGIIDAFIEEDDGIILIDYKTDRCSSDEELINKYKAQLYYYAKALEKFRQKPVKAMMIWSFCLERSIIIS